jgi:phage gp45-like
MEKMPFNDEVILSKYMIKTHYIMKVLAFHPETQTVDLVQDVYEFTNAIAGEFSIVNELGMEVTASLQNLDVLYGIPVKQERWGKWHVQCCPAEGDTGYIEVMTNDIQDWVENGSLSIPWSDDHFLKKSCVFVPFVPNKTNCDPEYPANNDSFVIKSDKINITMTSPTQQEGEEEPGKEKVVLTMTGITLTIDAEGKVTLDAPDAAVSANCKTVEAKASDSVKIDTPETTITGKLNVDGDVTLGSKLDVTADATFGANITATGTVTCAGVISSGVVSGSNISTPSVPSMNDTISHLQTHTHPVPGVQTGSGSTTTGTPNL